MPQVTVELDARSYDILAGKRMLQEAGQHLSPLLRSKRVIVITDETVARLYLHRFSSTMEDSGIRCQTVVLPPGEATKSFAQFEELMETLLSLAPDRHTMLVALGGGVIGDITGFAASVLLRGVEFIQIPTTLLAQVDSSVGGKTAINARHGKNLIGTFYQPKLVLADIGVLSTLPVRHLRAGYAEVVKYGLITEPDFFAWLEANGAAALAGDAGLRAEMVARCCRIKAAIVAADEREQGQRALLNFGHTFGHALEAETGFSETLLHGEAVALGMMMAFRLSVKMGLCPAAEAERVASHYAAVQLPTNPLHYAKNWDSEAMMQHFLRDKKASDGKMTFILTRGIGQAFVTQEVEAALVREVLSEYLTS